MFMGNSPITVSNMLKKVKQFNSLIIPNQIKILAIMNFILGIIYEPSHTYAEINTYVFINTFIEMQMYTSSIQNIKV